MPSPSRADSPRRQAILDAALACFLRDSVAGTTIESVRAGSGASVGSIYHHFDGKEGLAADLYLEILRDYHDAFNAVLQSSRSARAGVEGSVAMHLRWIAHQPDRARYLFNCREPEVIARTGGAVKALNVAFYAEANSWVEGHVERGHIRPLTPRISQALWMGPCLEFARQWLARTGQRRELSEAETVLGRAAWDSLRKR
jgi:AcrR family transcriptional regulator